VKLAGVLYALGAGLFWGLVFITPILLPDYSGVMLSFGRYLAFGIIALIIAWPDRKLLHALERADWVEAGKLSLVGNLIYYSALAAAIQLAEPPLPTMIIGALPVVIAIAANFKDASLPWKKLALPLGVIAAGISCVNHEELIRLQQSTGFDPKKHLAGAALAILALACWTWYPIRNSRWLQKRLALNSSTWATAQGLTTLPLALVGYASVIGLSMMNAPISQTNGAFNSQTIFGPTPLKYVSLMFVLGFFASWLGTLFWNKASQLLPTSLVGQLIVFETLSALLYAYLWRAEMPGALSLLGMALLIIGVILGVRAFNKADVAVNEH
jgi:drug/metabolite transporter (DMT)-like permease